MKTKIIIISLFFYWAFSISFAQQTYYYYSGYKIPLEYSTKKIYIKFNETASIVDKETVLSIIPYKEKTDFSIIHTSCNYSIVEFLEARNEDDFQNILLNINRNENTIIALPYLQSVDGETLVGITETFLVKLYTPNDYGKLEQMAKATNTHIIQQNEFVPELYEIEADKNSIGNALEMANYFYENGNFEYSTPDLIYRFQLNCATDPLFSHQWGLKNVGQNGGVIGMDINICEAWEITKGCSNIKIAVLDNGVDINHPDLVENLLQGYNVTENTYIHNGDCEKVVSDIAAHGTCCAGIIASKKNTIGVTGVAPNCKIIPVRIPFDATSFEQTARRTADGMNWAWQNGADILSNSWSWNPKTPHDAIKGAINAATSSGRNGLGCIVVFSSGNNNTIVQYPANLSNVIAVGAIDRCGFRAGKANSVPNTCDPWTDDDPGSCFGINLDLVAPGTNIYTTDISGPYGHIPGSDYEPNFGGTSAATPFVAGVAALILSVNPNLTYQEVYKYLMLGCDKTGDYPYIYSEKYGIWDYQVGYGKVNAYKSLQYLLGSERLMNNLTGTNTNTTNMYQWELIRPINGLAAGVYFVKRYEIKSNINFLKNETVVATSNGLSPNNPNYGNPFTKITYLSETSATLTTYVYELYNILGQSVGFKPVSPSNVRFNVSLFAGMEKDLYLNNLTLTNQTTNFEAINHIETQNVTISGNSNVNFHAGNSIVWKDGTTISPSGNGVVRAYIEPFILGECEPNRYLTPNYIFPNPMFSEEFLDNNKFDKFDFILVPNPTTTHSFTIHPIGEAEEIIGVQVYNLVGQILYQSNTFLEESITLPNNAKGVLFVKITTLNKVMIKKIVAQ